MIASYGWTWEYIAGHMTMSRLRAIQSYERINPPMHQLLSAYIGYKPPDAADKKPEELDLAGLIAALGG